MSAHPPPVIGLGELLWDVFPDCRRPGGAPANVAFHAAQLGLRGIVASPVGADSPGDELVEFLNSRSLDTSLIQRDPLHPTGQVTVDLSDEGHPDFVIHENAAWDHLEPLPPLLDTARNAAAVCFGTLAQRSPVSRATIHQVLAACSNQCLTVYDVNLRQHWYQREWIERSLALSTIVKLNREEAPVLAELLGLDAGSLETFARTLMDQHGVNLVCITRAEDGCLLIDAGETIDVPGRPVTVVDAVGAGDAFTAALIAARLWNWPLRRTAEFANAVGGLVAAHPGAMPPLGEELASLRIQFEASSAG